MVIAILLLFAFGITGVFISSSNNIPVSLAGAGMSTFSIIMLFIINMSNHYNPIVIEKGQDSDWIISNNPEIQRDTCITSLKLIEKDTILYTTCYKIIKK